MSAKSYTARIDGKDFNHLSRDEVLAWKALAGQIPQHGIKYVKGKNVVVLTTNNLNDLDDAFTLNDGWEHSKSPNRVAAGWTVIVVPNAALMRSERAYGISFTALGKAHRNVSGTWSSQKI